MCPSVLLSVCSSDHTQGCWEWHRGLYTAFSETGSTIFDVSLRAGFSICCCVCDLWFDLVFRWFGSLTRRGSCDVCGKARADCGTGSSGRAGPRCRKPESRWGVTSVSAQAHRGAVLFFLCNMFVFAGSKCRWEITFPSVIHPDPSRGSSVLGAVHFWKRRVNFAEGSYGTLTVSTSAASAESPANLQPYLLHNKFPRETQAQVHWSVEAEKKLETSRTHRHSSTDYS